MVSSGELGEDRLIWEFGYWVLKRIGGRSVVVDLVDSFFQRTPAKSFPSNQSTQHCLAYTQNRLSLVMRVGNLRFREGQ